MCAALVRANVISRAQERVLHDIAARLEQEGPEGYPGLDDLDLVADVVGGAIALSVGEAFLVVGDEGISMHIGCVSAVDGAWPFFRTLRALAKLSEYPKCLPRWLSSSRRGLWPRPPRVCSDVLRFFRHDGLPASCASHIAAFALDTVLYLSRHDGHTASGFAFIAACAHDTVRNLPRHGGLPAS